MSYVFDVEISGMYLVVKLRSSGEVVLTPLTEGYLLPRLLIQMSGLVYRHQRVQYVPEWPLKDTRIDIIGSNGNCGDHYDKI